MAPTRTGRGACEDARVVNREERTPNREVVHGDAIEWLRANPRSAGVSVIASLPDVSELGISLERWREFFAEAASLCLDAAADDGLTVFFQTDLKVDGRWISKSGIVLAAAERAGVPLLWHKIVCRREVGRIVHGRPGYSHLLAFSRTARDDTARATPDVLPDLGTMPWSHSMGTRAARTAVDTIRAMSPTTTRIVVPFCGIGTALAVSNEGGYDALGIERKRKRAELARTLTLDAGTDGRAARSESH